MTALLKNKICVCLALLVFAANAKTSVNELTRDDIGSALEDARLSQGVYDDDANVPAGYSPYSSFLDSSSIEKGFTLADGRVVFRFKQNAGLSNALYAYNPENGMITPYEGDPLRLGTELWPEGIDDAVAPNFVAQVLEKDGEIVVSFRGSDKMSDWQENYSQFRGRVPPQFHLADLLVQSIQDVTDAHIRLTGHSEGGGEVQYAIMRSTQRGETDVSGTTFNSQRLSEDVLNGFDDETRESASRKIQNYRMGNDVVSGWEALGENLLGDVVNLGEVCFVGDYFCFRPIEAHGIGTIIDRLEMLLEDRSGERAGTEPEENGGNGNASSSPFDDYPESENGGNSGAKDRFRGLKPIKLL